MVVMNGANIDDVKSPFSLKSFNVSFLEKCDADGSLQGIFSNL